MKRLVAQLFDQFQTVSLRGLQAVATRLNAPGDAAELVLVGTVASAG